MTFKIGDKVRAIDDTYNITNIRYDFEGIVEGVNDLDGHIDIRVTQTTYDIPQNRRLFRNLEPQHFELIHLSWKDKLSE